MFSLHDLDLLQTTLKWRLKCVQSRTIRNKTKIQSNPLRSYPPTRQRQVNDFSWIGTWCLLHSWPCHFFFLYCFWTFMVLFCFRTLCTVFALKINWNWRNYRNNNKSICCILMAKIKCCIQIWRKSKTRKYDRRNFFQRFIVVQGNMWRILMGNQ